MQRAKHERTLRIIQSLALASLSVANLTAANGQTVASWVNPVSGTWTDPTKWSTNPVYPNNSSSDQFAAVINTTGGAYGVTIYDSLSLNSLQLNSTSATLTHEFGTLSVTGPINLTSGTFSMGVGTLVGATINALGNAKVTSFAETLRGVTLNADLLANTVGIYDGLTLANNHRINLVTNCNFFGTQALGGLGEINFASPTFGTVENTGDLTIGPNVTVRTGIGSGVIRSTTGGTVINQGLIWAQTSGRWLEIQENWVNLGVMRVSPGGTLALGGTFTRSSLGVIERLGGTLSIIGTIPNANSTFLVDSSVGPLAFNGGTISGGTLQITAGTNVTVPGIINLNSVTLDTTDPWVVDGSVLTSGNLTLTGDTIRLEHSAAYSESRISPQDSGPHSLVGTGTIIFGGNSDQGMVGGGISTTIGPGITIETGTRGGNVLGDGLINQGTLVGKTPGKVLVVSGNNWKNDGVLKVDGGHLTLGGTFSTASIGQIQRNGGTLSISGTLNNANSTLQLGGATGSWQLGADTVFPIPAQINGGTISSSDTSPLIFRDAGPSRLDNVILDCDSRLFRYGGMQVVDTLTVGNGHTISLEGGSLTGTGTISGDGEIVFNGEGQIAPQLLTFEQGIKIRTGSVGGTISGTTISKGIISAETAGNQLTLQGNWLNLGTIQLSAGTLNLAGTFTFPQVGAIDRTGGALVISGTLNNSSSTFDVASLPGQWSLKGGKITGGTVTTSDGPLLVEAAGRLESLTLDADVVVLANALQSSLTLENVTWSGPARKIRLEKGAPSPGVRFIQSTGMIGLSEVIIAGTRSFAEGVGGATLSLPSSLTVRTEDGGGGTLGGSFVATINNGTIASDSLGANLLVTGSTVTNSGVLQASNGGMLNVDPMQGNIGTLILSNGGAARFSGNYTNARTTEIPQGCSLTLAGTWSNISTLNAVGSILSFEGTWANNGTVQMDLGTLSLRGTPTAVGAMQLSNGTMLIGTTLSTSQVDSIVRSNARLLLQAGTINNSNASLSVGGTSESWYVDTKTTASMINGGTIGTSGAASLTVRSGGTLKFQSVYQAGAINVNFGGALLSSGSWNNSGTIINAGTVEITDGSTFKLGTIINNGGTVVFLGGTLNNSNAVIDLTANVGRLRLSYGTLSGGTVQGGASEKFYLGRQLAAATGTLNGVTLAVSTVQDYSMTTYVTNNLTLSNARFDLTSGSLIFLNNSSLVGTGTFVPSATSFVRNVGTAAFGEGIVVTTDPSTSALLGLSNGKLIINGTVTSPYAGQTMTVQASLTSQGTFSASNGGILALSTGSLSNYSGGTLTGGTWAVDGNSTMSFGTSSITTNNANIILDGVGATMAAINPLRTNLGRFTITNDCDFTSVGTLTNSGTITVGPKSVLRTTGDLFNTGTIDLAGGVVLVDYAAGSPANANLLVDQVGTKIITSSAITNPALRVGYADNGELGAGTFAGQSIDASTMIFMMTFAGDSNLDGAVNTMDFNRLAGNFGATGTNWLGSDFDYNHVVDSIDFSLFMTGYGQKLPVAASLEFGAVVPEVSTCGLASALCFAGRRRRCGVKGAGRGHSTAA